MFCFIVSFQTDVKLLALMLKRRLQYKFQKEKQLTSCAGSPDVWHVLAPSTNLYFSYPYRRWEDYQVQSSIQIVTHSKLPVLSVNFDVKISIDQHKFYVLRQAKIHQPEAVHCWRRRKEIISSYSSCIHSWFGCINLG